MTTMRTSLTKHDICLEAFLFYNDLLPSDALYTRCNRMISSKMYDIFGSTETVNMAMCI